MTDRGRAGHYHWLDVNSPMTDETATYLVTQLARTDPSLIVDVGCGWGELLLRLLAACPHATGLGIDHDGDVIERATRNASARHLLDRVTFRADLVQPVPADLVLNVGAEHVFGDLDRAPLGRPSIPPDS